MIDTDKYEGHTEGSWEGILSGYFTIEQLDKTDKVLMQDAPLLLEEVKRLREGIKAYLLRYLPEELEHHELKELIE